ncbi:MAG: DotU family type IV/VI secretion system protein [Alphaproteobacteria bacterium]|nr:DotU family type IV/VI secretion system protein [Alphaproteobacteria bacterium]
MAVQPVSPMSKAQRKAGMGSAGGGPTAGGAGAYILDQFREFYDEVLILREEALMSGRARAATMPSFDEALAFDPNRPKPPPLPGFNAPPPLPGEAAPQGGDLDQDDDDEATAIDNDHHGIGLKAEEALRRLQTLLEMQALEAGRRGGEYGVLYYREAQYVMAALADEIFLTLDWPGHDFWRNDLLETRLFESYNAGDVFFKRMEKLLKTGDRVQAEIAIVYLLALTFGFRGRYAGGRDEARISEYRKQLYYYIYQKRPSLGDPSHRLAPEAYQHTQMGTVVRMLPSPGRWVWLFVGVVLIYGICAHIIFNDALAPLLEALDRAGG